MKHEFKDYLKSGGNNNLTVTILAIAGLICGAKSFTGTQINLIEYCFKPALTQNPGKFCTPEKHYIMPESEFNAEIYAPSNPEYQRDNFVPAKATRIRLIPASNPQKPLWGIAATILMSSAWGLSKARENRLIKLLPLHREEIKVFWLIAKIHQALRGYKEAYTAQLDYEFHQWLENRRIKDTQLAALTPQELGIYQQQIRLKAQAESQTRLQKLTGQPVAQLPGKSLDDVTTPGDKLASEEEVEEIVKSADQWEHYRQIGQAIINSMVVSDKSILIASGTGTGKTTTEQYYLQQLINKYPQIEIYALINKNDELTGVSPERRLIFKPQNLGKVTLEELLAPLYVVYNIYLERKSQSAEIRKHLKESQPIRLILGDWYATYQELLAQLKKEELQKILSMIRQIITVGRDMGVGLIVDTQSANLDSLGLANDASIRQSLDIYAQGFIYYEDGSQKGELQTIRLVFNNNAICGSEDRINIAESYQLLSNAIEQGQLKQPIIFTSVGAKPRLGIVPHINVNTNEISNQTIPITRQLDVETLQRIYELEIQIQPPPTETPKQQHETLKQPDSKDYSTQEQHFTKFRLSREEAIAEVMRLRNEMKLNQTEVIKILWGAKPGDNKAYKDAITEYKQLMGDCDDE